MAHAKHQNILLMVKTSTQENSISAVQHSTTNDLKPSRAVISFLVNYSKALEIKKTKKGENLSHFKN